MHAADLFPGRAFIPAADAARAIGLNVKTLKNQLYAGKAELKVIKIGGRLVVPAIAFDAFVDGQLSAAGLLVTAGVKLEGTPKKVMRGPGRPRKLEVGHDKG